MVTMNTAVEQGMPLTWQLWLEWSPLAKALARAALRRQELRREVSALQTTVGCTESVGPLALLEWSTDDRLDEAAPRLSVAVDARTWRERKVAFSAAYQVLSRMQQRGVLHLNAIGRNGFKSLRSECYGGESAGWFHQAVDLVRRLNDAGANARRLEYVRKELLDYPKGLSGWFNLRGLARAGVHTRDLLYAGLENFLGWWVEREKQYPWASRRMLAHVRLQRAGVLDPWSEVREQELFKCG